jgi:type VI secretion system protein ImpC
MSRESGQPFRICVIGDFGGVRETPEFVPRVIDRDNFEDVLRALRVAHDVSGTRFELSELDDFDPDRLLEVLGDIEDSAVEETPARVERSGPPPADLLGAIIAEQDDDDVPAPLKDASDLERFVSRAVAGHVVPAPTPKQVEREERRRATQADRLRAVLHDPRFQALEAAWRGLHWLVREVDTDAELKIYLLDLPLSEFVKRLDEVRTILTKKGPWAVLIGHYAFGQSETEVRALGMIGALARALQAPFVAEAGTLPDDAARAWAELRESEVAEWLGLVMPRFLLRLPYGKETVPIESIPFEEMNGSEHEKYLWGNPALVCAMLLGQGFSASGWDLEGISRRVTGLPIHVYREDGESVAKPCAEILMTQSDAESLLEAGIMPLATIRDTDAAVLVRLQSIAKPLRDLAGLG